MRSKLLAAATLLTLLASPPASAGSQSSNSSSNCSNGHCTRLESYNAQHGRHRHGWTRLEQWRERTPAWPRRPWHDDD